MNNPYASSSSIEHPLCYRASQKRKSINKAASVKKSPLADWTGIEPLRDMSTSLQVCGQSDFCYEEDSGFVTARPGLNKPRLSIDFAQLFTSEIYEFMIGEEEVSFKVHGEALKGLSEPLWYMLKNSNMQESLTKTVRIPDHDPDTFAKFLKFAYLGFCGMSDGMAIRTATQVSLPAHFRCHICGSKSVLDKNQQYPFHGQGCRDNYNSAVAVNRVYRNIWVYCIAQDCSNYWQVDSTKTLLCHIHREKTETNGYPDMREVNDPVPGLQDSSRCSPKFVQRRYGCGNLSHEDLSRRLRKHTSAEKSVSLYQARAHDTPLVDHAKLYVFAHQYMVEDLQDISLHKLHRNLTVTDITCESIGELIELVTFRTIVPPRKVTS